MLNRIIVKETKRYSNLFNILRNQSSKIFITTNFSQLTAYYFDGTAGVLKSELKNTPSNNFLKSSHSITGDNLKACEVTIKLLTPQTC